ncbi:ATP-binding protein [Sphingomonas sp. ASY06-1R]|uniref:ATP-binding protein n=1 Tax=Sphingomonas sp. ASY06-1R TaxID=3445771 RepID=UPI003FA244D8
MADGTDFHRGERIRFGPFDLFPGERLLTKDNQPVDIGGRSFDLLVALIEQPGRVLSKRELLKRVWSDVVVEDGSLRFHMAGLRKLLGEGQDGARYIATQVGVGYAFVAPVDRAHPAGTPMLAEPVAIDDDRAPRPAGSSNLPARLPRLIGRDKDIDLLIGRITDTSLFTIVGSAGVGKTTLAIEIAHRLAAQFDNPVTFVDLAMLEDPALVPQMVAGAMGIAVQSDDPAAAILGHIRDRRQLILLDNCEHLVDAVSRFVERMIEAAPNLHILATSREALRIRDEHVHHLEAMDYPDAVEGHSLEELLAYPAVQLFCERAITGDSSLRIDLKAARLIADMCRRLDGMALAIELAAVRVATHGLVATARMLGARFSLGWSGRRTASPRQQTLQSMLDWSYDLLSDGERIVLQRLSVFVGPFSVDAALEVVADGHMNADEVAAGLDELTSKSFVVPDRSRGTATYRLLEMTRAYAREKLVSRESAALTAVAKRHAGFFLAELEAAVAQDEDAFHDARAIRQQLGNIRSALDWSFGEQGDLRIGVRLAAAAAGIFLNLSSLVECRTWCARALGEIQEAQRGSAIELELQAALGISLMFTRGNSQAAGDALVRALDVATALEDHWNQLRILGLLHIFHERIAEYSTAFAYAERAVEIAKTIDEPEALGVAYSLSGISHHLAGDQIRAKQDLELSLANSPPSRRGRTIRYGFDHRNRSAIALARTLWLTGHPGEAVQLAGETAGAAARMDHPVTHCIALIWSLAVFSWAEDFDKAEQALHIFSTCAEVNAMGPYIAAANGLRGELQIQRGRTGDALGALQESLSRLRAIRYELLTIPFSIALSHGLMLAQRLPEARDLIDQTIARCNATEERLMLAEALRIKARIARANGAEASVPEALLSDAMTLARAQGAYAWQLRAAIDQAELLIALARSAEAAARLGEARTHFAEADMSHDVRRADALLAGLGS